MTMFTISIYYNRQFCYCILRFWFILEITFIVTYTKMKIFKDFVVVYSCYKCCFTIHMLFWVKLDLYLVYQVHFGSITVGQIENGDLWNC